MPDTDNDSALTSGGFIAVCVEKAGYARFSWDAVIHLGYGADRKQGIRTVRRNAVHIGGAMKAIKQIQALYRQIPGFKCKPGCTDCCGPVPFSKSEWGKVKDKRCATSLDCPYSLAGKCDIYEDRPFICRLYGATSDPGMQCPHGCKPSSPLTAGKAKELTDKYVRLMHT